MKYKYLAILITVIFILSCLNGVFAHPGHGTEYPEEVSSSSSSSVQSTPSSTSDGGPSQSSSSGSGSGSSSGSGQSSSSGSGGSSDTSNHDNLSNKSNNLSAVNNSSSNQVVNEDSQLFSITNILIMLIALIIGFFAVVIIFKFLK